MNPNYIAGHCPSVYTMRDKIKTHMILMQNEYNIVKTHEFEIISYLIDNEIIPFVEKYC